MVKKKNKKDKNGLVVTYNDERKVIEEGDSWVYTDSLNLAEVMQVEHKEVLRKIRKILKDYNIELLGNYKISSYISSQNQSRPYYKLSKTLTKIVVSTFKRNTNVKDILQKIGGQVYLTTKEIDFLDLLTIQLEVFNIPKGIKQYGILNYHIDYYIPKLNIAIEYDENNHDNYTYKQQEGRQKEIEEELGCQFVRVSDEYSHAYNSAFVIKNII